MLKLSLSLFPVVFFLKQHSLLKQKPWYAVQCLHILFYKRSCICLVYLAASSVLLDPQRLSYMHPTSRTLNQSSKYGTLLPNQVYKKLSNNIDSRIRLKHVIYCLNVLTRLPCVLCCGDSCGTCSNLLLRAALWEDAYDSIRWDLLINGFSYCKFLLSISWAIS